MGKIYKILFLILMIPCLTSSAQMEEDDEKKRKLIGFGLGGRKISVTTEEVYFEGEKVNFGTLSPFLFSAYFQSQIPNNLVLNFELDFLLSKTLTGTVMAGCGYRMGPKMFNLVPLFSIGYGGASTELKEYNIGNSLELDKKVFVGANSNNQGRGKGENLTLKINSGFFLMKPEVQGQFHIGKISLIGSLAYNVAFGGRGKMKFSGKGYSSKEDFRNSTKAPEWISVRAPISEILTDQNDQPITKTPMRFSGVAWSIGLAYKIGR